MGPAGALLEEGAVGTDEAREAKIEETLRKMGIKGAQDIAKENQKSVGEKITSIFDVGLPRCFVVVCPGFARVCVVTLYYYYQSISCTWYLSGLAWVSRAWRRISPMSSVCMQYW